MLISWGRSFRSALLSGSVVAVKDNQSKEEEKEEWYVQGWERVKKMYIPGEHGEMSTQSGVIIEACLFSFFAGFTAGALPAARNAMQTFVKENQPEIYHSHKDVKQRLQNKVVGSLLRSGFRLGLRLSSFVTVSVVTFFTVNAFKEKLSVTDFVIGGTIIGAAAKFKYGNKAMMKSAFAAGCAGAGVGFAILQIMKYTGAEFTFDLTDLVGIDVDRTQPRQKKENEQPQGGKSSS